jgi:transposase
MWVAVTDLPTAVSHPFYRRLNQFLREHGFDDFAEAQCASFYGETMGRPGLPPGIYFRLLLIGYFEGIDSERAVLEHGRFGQGQNGRHRRDDPGG